MPNTFVHLGVQSVSSKALFREADIKWIGLGCVIPDIPWIIKRLILFAHVPINVYDLTLYSFVQASLFFSLILSGALASLATKPVRIFALLAFNVLFHLVLDAMQIKWANGVHFFAPLSWQLTGFNFVWPEHVIVYCLTAIGLILLAFFGAKDGKKQLNLCCKPARFGLATLLATLYFTTPLFLITGPEQADVQYINTLRDVEQRAGKYIEVDRGSFNKADQTIKVFGRITIQLTGPKPSHDSTLSIQGRFSDNNTIHISQNHVHSPVRDLGSAVALAGIFLLWLLAWIRGKIIPNTKHLKLE